MCNSGNPPLIAEGPPQNFYSANFSSANFYSANFYSAIFCSADLFALTLGVPATQ